MRKNSTIKPALVRTPNAEGSDVVFNRETRDFDAFANGNYVGSRSNSEDAWIVARAASAPQVEAPVVEQAAPVERVEYLNLDTTIEAMEARPETPARRSAWIWLAEQSSVRFVGDALIVPSATWSSTTYRVTETCTCPSRKPCWHLEARAIVMAALAEDRRYDLEADNAIWKTAYEGSPSPYHAIAHHEATEAVQSARIERRSRAYSDMMECFA